MVHANWDLQLNVSKSSRQNGIHKKKKTNIRREFLVFVNPVVKHAERAHDEEGFIVLVFTEIRAKCNCLESLSQTHFVGCEMIGYAQRSHKRLMSRT